MSIPSIDRLTVTTTIDAVMARIELATGIGSNRHTPPESATRPELSASIRHTLAYVFQKQTEISQPGFLFHGQSDHWVAQSIKDTFPYFIGAVEDDHVELSARLRALRRDLLSLTGEARVDGLVAESEKPRDKTLRKLYLFTTSDAEAVEDFIQRLRQKNVTLVWTREPEDGQPTRRKTFAELMADI
jgi:hypothetical protein